MRFFTHRWVQVAFLFAFLGLAVFMRVQNYEFLQRIQNLTFDFYNKTFLRPSSGMDVVIVDIDESSLKNYGQWPWSRMKIAELVQKIDESGARAIGFDMAFAEPDRTSPTAIAKDLQDRPGFELVTEKLLALPSNEEVFANALARSGRVVTAFAGTEQETSMEPMQVAAFVPVAGFKGDTLKQAKKIQSIAATMPQLESAAAGNGSFSATPDTDGIIRRVPLIISYQEKKLYPALSTEIVRVAHGVKRYEVFGDATNPLQIGGIKLQSIAQGVGFSIPTDASGHIYIYYAGSRPEMYLPAWKVLQDFPEKRRLKDKMVLIGSSAIGLKDLRSSPINPVIPGVELHAEIIEQIVHGQFLTRPSWVVLSEVIALVLVSSIIILCMPYVSISVFSFFIVVLVGSGITFALKLYEMQGLLIDTVYPTLTIITLFIAASIFKNLRSEMEKKAVRQAFGHYLSPVLIEELANDPEKLKLGGEVREVSVMFTDIRNFTTISEGMDPADLIRMMNDFLTPMTSRVLENRGTVDKYMGDAMMAFWNAPLDDADHARNACTAALEMVSALGPVNDLLKADAEKNGKSFKELRAGIGVHTGRASVGNMGSKQRFAYSALGDTVNLASRLEGQTKGYGISIMISEETRKQAPEMAAIEIDLLTVKGKSEPVRVYTLLGDAQMAQDPAYQAFAVKHAEMLQAYRAQKWDVAGDMLKTLETSKPNLAGLYALYAERIKAYRSNPPPADWAGIWVAKDK